MHNALPTTTHFKPYDTIGCMNHILYHPPKNNKRVTFPAHCFNSVPFNRCKLDLIYEPLCAAISQANCAFYDTRFAFSRITTINLPLPMSEDL